MSVLAPGPFMQTQLLSFAYEYDGSGTHEKPTILLPKAWETNLTSDGPFYCNSPKRKGISSKFISEQSQSKMSPRMTPIPQTPTQKTVRLAEEDQEKTTGKNTECHNLTPEAHFRYREAA